MHWYLEAFRNYGNFSGRASRSAYWMFVLFNIIFSILAVVLDNVLGLTVGRLGYGLTYGLYALVVLLPSLAVTVRRLHDIGKSGWMILISLIPLVGAIWLLVLLATDSKQDFNPYTDDEELYGEDEVHQNLSGERGDKLILIIVIWMLFTRIIWSLLPYLNPSFYSASWFKPLSVLMTLISSLIPIALAFLLKSKSLRIVLFILGGIYFLFAIYDAMKRFNF